MSKNKPPKAPSRVIIVNKKARFDYFLEQSFEAGLALEGWEVKSIRAGRIQLRDSYVILKDGEAWLIGVHITPLETASTHITPESQRTRKLLLHKKELSKLFGAVHKQGLTIVATNLHWHKNRVKAEICIAKGKKSHDKRQTIKEREWKRSQTR